MGGIVLYVVALLVVIVESALLTVFSIQIWAVQTPLVLAVVLALDRDFVTGGLVLAGLFLPVEWLIGGAAGVYSLGLAAVFFALHAVRPNLQQVWGVARGITAGLAALLHGVVVLTALFLIGEGGTRLSAAVAWQLWMSAPVVGVASVVAGRAFARVDEFMDPRGGDRGLEHGP